jgi:hypothetical protein
VVHSPYTPFFSDAFMAAHVAIGILLLCIAWWMFPRASVVRGLFGLAVLLVTTSPLLGEFLRGFGALGPASKLQQDALLVSTCLVVFGFGVLRRFVMAVVAVAVAYLLIKIQGWVLDSALEICALHLVWLGVALGIVRRRASVDDLVHAELKLDCRSQDLIIFFGATLLAALASIFVLSRADGSADEWAYTWQAATFAKGHIFGSPPPCENAFQNFYVFESLGRLFVQYTPGWPYFMTPFMALGLPWLAGPFSHGLLAVGVARVARRAAALDAHGSATRISSAGWIAGFVSMTGTTVLVMGASRYSHTFVAALFAWAIEASMAVQDRHLSTRRAFVWGAVLGSAVALMGAARPADGATLALGLFLYVVYCLIRRRIGGFGFIGGLVGLIFWGGLTLVILRIQLGTWFTTGYSLDKIIHPWAVARYGWPKPNEWKFALPLATGAYAWFPCSLAVGFAGVASLRGRASGLIFICVMSMLCFDTYYQYIDLGRGFDWGYGPRYELPFVVPMAVGTGIALAPLLENARRRAHALGALYAGGPFAVAVCTMAVALVRLWPLLYPGIYAHVRLHDSLNERIREMNLHHAVVMAIPGATGFDALDLTENLPLDLYPNQDVLIAIERKPEFTRCVRTNFPDRAIYRATGNPVVITPY